GSGRAMRNARSAFASASVAERANAERLRIFARIESARVADVGVEPFLADSARATPREAQEVLGRIAVRRIEVARLVLAGRLSALATHAGEWSDAIVRRHARLSLELWRRALSFKAQESEVAFDLGAVPAFGHASGAHLAGAYSTVGRALARTRARL